MGGDHAPREIVRGAVESARSNDLSLILVGQEDRIRAELREIDVSGADIEVLHASEVVEMCDIPAIALRKKRDSSIRVGLRLVADGKAASFVSAGNSGAVMAGGFLILKKIQGVDRPAIAATIPTPHGPVVLVDAGRERRVQAGPPPAIRVHGRGVLPDDPGDSPAARRRRQHRRGGFEGDGPHAGYVRSVPAHRPQFRRERRGAGLLRREGRCLRLRRLCRERRDQDDGGDGDGPWPVPERGDRQVPHGEGGRPARGARASGGEGPAGLRGIRWRSAPGGSGRGLHLSRIVQRAGDQERDPGRRLPGALRCRRRDRTVHRGAGTRRRRTRRRYRKTITGEGKRWHRKSSGWGCTPRRK